MMRTFFRPEKNNSKNSYNSLSFISLTVVLIAAAFLIPTSAAAPAEENFWLKAHDSSERFSPSLAEILRDYVIINTPEGYMLQRRSHLPMTEMGKRLSKGDFQLRVRKTPASSSVSQRNFQLRVRKPFPNSNNFQLRVRKAAGSSSLNNFQLRVRKRSGVPSRNFQLRVRKQAGTPAQRNFQLRVRKSANLPSSNFQLRVRKNGGDYFQDWDEENYLPEDAEEELEEEGNGGGLRELLDRYQLMHTPTGVILRDTMEKRDAEEADDEERRDE